MQDLLAALHHPPAGFYFAVTFFHGGLILNPLDIRFRKVSGLNATIETQEIKEGGENQFSYRLPTRIRYENLILERGLVTGSFLTLEFNRTMSFFQFNPGNALVVLLNQDGVPHSSWFFMKVYPVRWSVSDLDADQSQIVVDTMELAYTRFQAIRG